MKNSLSCCASDEPSFSRSSIVANMPAWPATPPNAWNAFPSLISPISTWSRQPVKDALLGVTGYGSPVSTIRRSMLSPLELAATSVPAGLAYRAPDIPSGSKTSLVAASSICAPVIVSTIRPSVMNPRSE